jgi:hypothetical protein
MHSFLRIFIVVLLALVLVDWIVDRHRRADVNAPNTPAGWSLLSGDVKVPAGWSLLSGDVKVRSAVANESPKGTAPVLAESFLPGDIKYESPDGNVRIYFPIVTSIVLSILLTLILSFIGSGRLAGQNRNDTRRDSAKQPGGSLD